MHIINIDWDGPYSIESGNCKFHSLDCYGVYQVYGPHPVYGNQQLLYIGKASERTFSTRLPEHAWIHGTRDTSQVSIYLGRMCGQATPDDDTWRKEIDYAERLLIYAHFPPYNTQKWGMCSISDLKDVHVLNWKNHRDLLPEVSGLRWMDLDSEVEGYGPYTSRSSMQKEPNNAVSPDPIPPADPVG